MIPIPDYIIEATVYESRHTVVYRGKRISDGCPVMLKTHQSDYPSPVELAKLGQDYHLGHRIKGEGIITYYALERHAQNLVIIQEDFGAVSLSQEIPEDGFNLPTFLDIAVQLAGALSVIHHYRIIHKDLKPANIAINPATRMVKVLDFGVASQLSQETQPFLSPDHLEGTLAYVSPEQTGRMNRAIDYRTDFYSLGVTLYECLCGHCPFVSDDPLELVHSHLARMPPPPYQLKPEIPRITSDIVMKLMAKNPEARYQSGYGLKADLLKCRTELETQGKIKVFTLGRQDSSDRFHIPQKLYGREREIETLLAAFERVSSPPQPSLKGEEGKGGAEILLVAGYAGVGKSALVREIHKPITQKRGYFIAGKYDQLQRNTPYLAFSQAFNEFCTYLLTEREADLAAWREKILAAVGPNGQILTELIPKLEQIIGPQPPVVQVGPQEAQNRFNWVFQNFIKVICQLQHPLVLYLDDLQWADLASLNLLQALMSDGSLQYLLIIGSYRDNEVDSAHPLLLALAAMEQEGIIVNTLELQNLSAPDVTALLVDTLRIPKGRDRRHSVRNLSNLIYEKTQGNAFFTIEFLKSLSQNNLLTFQTAEQDRRWIWDIEQIRRQNITNNVVALMAEKIGSLPADTQDLVKLAACLGNQFDLETLTTISQAQTAAPEQAAKNFNIRAILEHLWPAIQEGFILSLDNNYKALLEGDFTYLQTGDNDETLALTSVAGTVPSWKGVEGAREGLECKFKFSHDRIQQAAYALIEETGRASLHLRIGRLLLATTPPSADRETMDHLFDIANHFNQAGTRLLDDAERLAVAALNLQAGQRAKQAGAYAPALTYLQAGGDLLPEGAWQSHYRLMFDLHQALAETASLTAHYELAETLYALLLQKAHTDKDKLAAYFVRMSQLQAQGRFENILSVGRVCLALLGILLPETEAEIQQLFEAEQQALLDHLAGRSIAEIIHGPLLTDERQGDLLGLLPNIANSAYMLSQKALLNWVAVKMTNISLQYGHAEPSAFGYMMYGTDVAIHTLHDYETGYQFSKMATELAGQFDSPFYKGRTYNSFVITTNLWKRHLATGIPYAREAYRLGLESGDLVFAGYAIFNMLNHLLVCGHPLGQLEAEASRFLPFLKRDNAAMLKQLIKPGVLQPLANLLGLTDTPLTFDNEDFSEQQFLQTAQEMPNYLAVFYVTKIRSFYWFGHYRAGLDLLDKAPLIAKAHHGRISVPEAYFFMSLTLTALYTEASGADQATYEAHLTQYQAQMKIWAGHCPDNFEHKYLLVEAERARLAGHFTGAMALYKQAIDSAKQYNYLNNEALGNELYARFWLEHAEEEFAQIYMRRAHVLYQQWGARGKVADLEEKYPRLLAQAVITIKSTSESPVSLTATTSSASTLGRLSLLDVSTVIKAIQTLSSQISLDTLLTNLMKLVIENAGAQKGSLILKRDGRHVIEAVATVDSEAIYILQSIPLSQTQELAASIVRYVSRTGETVLRQTPAAEDPFIHDPYIIQYQPKSILCLPVRHREQITAILYLENSLVFGAFTEDRLVVLNILLAQTAISLQNALLYEDLKQEIAGRVHAEEALKVYSERLEDKVKERTQALQAAQEQLIQQEKLAVLGQLASGVAHEIRNPLGVISNAVYFLQMISPGTDQTIHDYLELIASRVGEAEKIISDLLVFSHTRLPMRETAEVGWLIADVLARTPPSEQVQVTLDIAPELPPVFVDTAQIGQLVLANHLGPFNKRRAFYITPAPPLPCSSAQLCDPDHCGYRNGHVTGNTGQNLRAPVYDQTQRDWPGPGGISEAG